MLTAEQVIEADPIDRVGCPVCDQRRCVDLDCHCCGGMGYVDADDVYETLHETLADCCFGRECSAPDWVGPGFYTVVGGAYVVLHNRTVDYVTDEQMVEAYRIVEKMKRPSVLSWLVGWFIPYRGAA